MARFWHDTSINLNCSLQLAYRIMQLASCSLHHAASCKTEKRGRFLRDQHTFCAHAYSREYRGFFLCEQTLSSFGQEMPLKSHQLHLDACCMLLASCC